MSKYKEAINHILDQLKTNYSGNPWYGPNITDSIQAITADKIPAHLPNTNTLGAILAHMIAWRTYTVRILQGDFQYAVSDEMNFPEVEMIELPELIERFQNVQVELIDGIEKFDPEQLDAMVPGKKFSYRTLLQGIVHHDIYHLGQINLLKK